MAKYQAVRDQNQELLRQAVIAAAEQILRVEGADGVTVRRVAQELDCSTTVLYHLFGNKDGLANALYQQGCHALHSALAAVPEQPDPHGYLSELAWAFWQFAHEQTHYYTLMFTGALAEFKPDIASLQQVATAIGLVVGVLERYQLRQQLRIEDPVLAANMLWAALHGVIHLQFAGHFTDAAQAKALYASTATTLINVLVE